MCIHSVINVHWSSKNIATLVKVIFIFLLKTKDLKIYDELRKFYHLFINHFQNILSKERVGQGKNTTDRSTRLSFKSDKDVIHIHFLAPFAARASQFEPRVLKCLSITIVI